MSEIIRSKRHAQTCSWLSLVSLLQLVEVVPRTVLTVQPFQAWALQAGCITRKLGW